MSVDSVLCSLVPERWCQDYENRKYFKPANEHHKGQEPLGRVGQMGIISCWTGYAETGADIHQRRDHHTD